MDKSGKSSLVFFICMLALGLKNSGFDFKSINSGVGIFLCLSMMGVIGLIIVIGNEVSGENRDIKKRVTGEIVAIVAVLVIVIVIEFLL